MPAHEQNAGKLLPVCALLMLIGLLCCFVDELTVFCGTGFGSVGTGFARLNVGTSHELVEDAVKRIGRALG